jgi:hypothetical protein
MMPESAAEPGTKYENPFERLPTELLLAISHHIPDLPSLLSFVSASRRLVNLLEAYGSEIIESVIVRFLPIETRKIVWIVTFIWRMPLKPDYRPSLNDFYYAHFFEERNTSAISPISIDTPPSILRRVLATFTKIAALSEACLALWMRRCLELRPCHLLDDLKSMKYLCTWDPWLPHGFPCKRGAIRTT